MATDDDRWSGFKEPGNNSNLRCRANEGGKQSLGDYLSKVLHKRSPTLRQERKYKVACTLIQQVTEAAHAINAQWKVYVPFDYRHGVKITPLRTLSEDKYDSMVPLIRPMRLDGFKIIQRGIDEMPQHRCLIQVNPALCRQEQQLVYNEWTEYIDKKGFLKPKPVLEWFNEGLKKACVELVKQHHGVDKLVCALETDGTATLHATTSEFIEGELFIDKFTVNIFPVFVIDALPSSMKLTAPLPCFGPYIHGQKAFRDAVLKDLEDGKQIAFLDPKREPSKGEIKRNLPREGPSWKLNLCFTEYHVYSLIDKYCRGLNFRHVLILLNILREEYPEQLKILNNDLLVNTLFLVSQKFIHKMQSKRDWVFRMLETLCEGLRVCFVPSFYMPRLNLLSLYGIQDSESKEAAEVLDEIIRGLKQNSKNLLIYTGCVEKSAEKEAENEEPQPEPETQPEIKTNNKQEHHEPEVVVAPTQETSMIGTHAHFEEESNRMYSVLMGNPEDESGISKPSKYGERSDIY